MLKSFENGTLKAYKTVLAWLITILILPFLILCWIYKQCVVLVGRIKGLVLTDDCVSIFFVEKVAFNDHVEHDYERRSLCNIGLYGEMSEGHIDINELTEKIQKSLIDKERVGGFKLKSYLVRFGGYSFWKQNPEFSVANHVHKVKLPPGEDIVDYLNIWMTEPYAPKTSFWRVLVVDTGNVEYMAIKIHHGLGDGISVNEVANAIFDEE